MDERWTCTYCGTENKAITFHDVCEKCKNPRAATVLVEQYNLLYPDQPRLYMLADTVIAIRVAHGGSPRRGDGTEWPNPPWKKEEDDAG